MAGKASLRWARDSLNNMPSSTSRAFNYGLVFATLSIILVVGIYVSSFASTLEDPKGDSIFVSKVVEPIKKKADESSALRQNPLIPTLNITPSSSTTTATLLAESYNDVNSTLEKCSNGVWDFNETWIDCGGPCPSCFLSCFDGEMNHGEEEVDCGGPCEPCLQCNSPLDCGVDHYGPYICVNNNVVREILKPRCVNGTCKWLTAPERVDSCDRSHGNTRYVCVPGNPQCVQVQ
ncbi:Uncharacterised protein [uncultured archaeon]|nr:Uncharacterised protein [uncultured archaeon]